MGVYRARACQRRRRKDVERALKWIIYPPAIATALVVQAVKSSAANSAKHESNTKQDRGSRTNSSTYGLSDKELRIINNIIILNRQYSWEDVDNIERLGNCNPITGEMDRNSQHYGYRVFYNDGCSKLVTLPKKKIEE